MATRVMPWMYNMNLTFSVGTFLWMLAKREQLTDDMIWVRLKESGNEMKIEIIRSIFAGKCSNINQLLQVALALNITFSEVVRRCEQDGPPKEIKKKIQRILA